MKIVHSCPQSGAAQRVAPSGAVAPPHAVTLAAALKHSFPVFGLVLTGRMIVSIGFFIRMLVFQDEASWTSEDVPFVVELRRRAPL
jgi:hypothetical protein